MSLDELDREAIDRARDAVHQLFPVELAHHKVTCRGEPMYVPALGLVAQVSLYDRESYNGPSADLIVVPREHVANPTSAIAALRAALESLGRDGAAAAAIERPLADTLGVSPAVYDETTFTATPADDARRAAALARANERFPAVQRHMEALYGLRLPRHVAVFDAMWRSMNEIERRGMDALGRRPGGIMIWFEDDGLERATRDGLDPRLECRFRCDPPEFVTLMWGDSDGLHYGLWYDDPAELPSFVVHNYARDSAETWGGQEESALQVLASELSDHLDDTYAEEGPDGTLWALKAVLTAFGDADREAIRADGPRKWAGVDRPALVGGVGPALPPDAGDPRCASAEKERRYEAYQARGPEVAHWIARAQEELAGGQPAFALVLGRELHWLDHEGYRGVALELLTGAYRALDREALANVARVHYAHRDLPSVSVYLDE